METKYGNIWNKNKTIGAAKPIRNTSLALFCILVLPGSKEKMAYLPHK